MKAPPASAAGELVVLERTQSLADVPLDALAAGALRALAAAAAGPDAERLVLLLLEAVAARSRAIGGPLLRAYERGGLEPYASVSSHAHQAEQAGQAGQHMGDFFAALEDTLERCNFSALSAGEERLLEASSYSLAAPVRVDWARLGDLPPPAAQACAAGAPGAAPSSFEGKLRVWHSGVTGEDRRKGRFLMQRAEVIAGRMLYALSAPLPLAVRRAARRACGLLDETPGLRRTRSLARGQASVRVAVRRRVQNLPLSELVALHKELEIAEPVFRRVVIAFRKNFSREVQLKMYRDVPIADLELCFPEKKVALNALESFKVAGAVFAGLLAALVALVGSLLSDVTSNASAVGAMLVALVSLAARQFFAFTAAQGRLDAAVAQQTFDQLIDTNKSTLLSLGYEAARQEQKEVLLCFTVILGAGASEALSTAEVKERAERMLQTELELGLQATAFDVRDALQKCEALGLIAQAPSGSWLAKAPCEALDMLADAKK